jgi:nucleotide-binding universal stress UspA family protein
MLFTEGRSQCILVGVDADARSDHALAAALELSRRFRARVELVHAVPIVPMAWSDVETTPSAVIAGPELLEATSARLRTRLTPLLGDARDPGTGAAPQLRVLHGEPSQVLIEEARSQQAGLVIIGAHKRRGLFDFGNTARALLGKCSAPVWLQVLPPRNIARILAPIDLSEAGKQALAAACNVARSFDASVHVLHSLAEPKLGYMGAVEELGPGTSVASDQARDATRAEFERTLAAFDWRGVPHTSEFTSGEPAERVIERQDECDLIVMGTHGRTGLAAAWLGSVANTVLKHAHTPVLVIREGLLGASTSPPQGASSVF